MKLSAKLAVMLFDLIEECSVDCQVWVIDQPRSGRKKAETDPILT